MKKSRTRFTEALKIDNPALHVWVNGTTKQRFDVQSGKFTHRNGNSTGPYNPLFFSMNIPDAISYSVSHGTHDYGNQVKTSTDAINAYKNGMDLVVFARIKDGTELFDFRDPKAFEVVFGAQNADLQKVFDHKEVYFAFNTTVKNDLKVHEPIEFRLAQLLLVWEKSPKNKFKSDGRVNTSFFDDNTFIDILDQQTNALVSPLGNSSWRKTYAEFKSFYNETIGDATFSTTKAGTQYWQRGQKRGRVIPDTLTDEQRDLVNVYFKLFNVYIDNVNLIPDDIRAKLRANMSGASREGFMDLCQAVLYAVISTQYDGYYCPEYIGAKLRNFGDRSATIALFTDDVIQATKAYATSDVEHTMNASGLSLKNATYNKIVRVIHDECEAISQKRAADEEAKKAEKARYEQEISIPGAAWVVDGKLDYDIVAKMENIRKICSSPSSPMYGKFTYAFASDFIEAQNKLIAKKKVERSSDLEKALAG